MDTAHQTLAPQDNVYRYLGHWATEFPNKTAIAFPRNVRRDGRIDYERITFAQLEAKAGRLAASLRARGIQCGDRVVVMVPMSLELYVLLLALLKMAAVIVFIDPWVGFARIKRCVELTEPKAFVGTSMIQAIARVTRVLEGIPHRITARGQARFGEWSLESLIDEEASPIETERVRPDTTALITFTTGSTGMPKGANRTHGFLVAQHLALARELRSTPGDIDLPALPIFILNNLASGVTSIVPKMKPSRPADIEPSIIVRQIQDFAVTTAVGSPAYFEPLASYCQRAGIMLPTLRAVFTGGGPVPPGLLAKLRGILPNGTAYVGYGSTEAEPVALLDADEACRETEALALAGYGTCVGTTAHGISAKIVRVVPGAIMLGPEGWDDVELPQGAIGELVVTGDHVGKDYYRNPQAVRDNKIVAPDGVLWHRMGDVGYFDEQGRLWIVARVNNVVTRSAKALYPLRVEAIVQQLPFVERAALLGLPDPMLGHRAAIIVMPPKTNPLTWLRRRAEWEQDVRCHLEQHRIPVDAVYFITRMPVDPRHNVKIDHARLMARFARRP